MAIIHPAQLTPSKLELLERWLPTRSWSGPAGATLTSLGAYRFDDPAGDVGLETLLVQADDLVLQVPLSYRSAPLTGAEGSLVGTLQHSVLGQRWAYDAGVDPVYAAALARTIRTGGRQARLMVQTGDHEEERPATTTVLGSGTATGDGPAFDEIDGHEDGPVATIHAGGWRLVVRHVLSGPTVSPASAVSSGQLRGTWPGRSEPALLAFLLGP